MKKSIALFALFVFFMQVAIAQNVGIGTTTPTAKLHVETGATNFTTVGVLITGTADLADGGTGLSPNLGAGARVMFYPYRSVFRAGTVTGTEWDVSNAGQFSTAFGKSTIAHGRASTATGEYTIARGEGALAIGMYNDPILAAPEISPYLNTPLFLVGNGTPVLRRNAFVVYWSGNADISGFTRLGKIDDASPRIKMKKITGITPNTSNPNTVLIINDGVPDGAKILSVDVIVRDGVGYGFIPNTENGSTYTVNLAPDLGGSIVIGVKSVALSSYVMGKAFTILLVYEE